MFSFKVKSMCIIFEFVCVREHVLACSSFSHTPHSFYEAFYWFVINFILSQYLSFPSLLLLSAFSIFPQKQSLKGKKNLFPQRYIYKSWYGMEGMMLSPESHSIPFSSHTFTCKYSLHWVIDLDWGPWLQLRCWNSTLTEPLLGYLVVALWF